mgnify:CR=1 FL=1
MIVTKKALPRRTLLRGMGAALSLPLLDAMVPAMTALAATPANPVRRLGFVYIPMGSTIEQWTPTGDDLKQLSPSLQSLAPVRDYVSVMTNMEIRNAYPGTHATSNASFLSAYGHNRKRLVKEGDAVKAGQAIAEMGDIAVNREGLHFEIRRNGKPSNPLDFLPAR